MVLNSPLKTFQLIKCFEGYAPKSILPANLIQQLKETFAAAIQKLYEVTAKQAHRSVNPLSFGIYPSCLKSMSLQHFEESTFTDGFGQIVIAASSTKNLFIAI